MRQQTIAEKVGCTGVGLHSGSLVQLSLHPARAHAGIVFVRTDLHEPLEIPARPGAVSSTQFATTLARDGVRVATVEHLLAAAHALGIDNLRVELDGPEVPVMDGSAAAFFRLLRQAGPFPQRAARPVLRILRPLSVEEGDRRIRVEPARWLRVSYAVDFEHPAIGRQELRLDRLDAECFEREIAGARTFGFLSEVQDLWRAGFARGGSLENAVVLDEEGVVNPSGLRWPDEFVRHKILDLLGDLALLGLPLLGHVEVERGGHSLHQRLVAEILDTPQAWLIEEPASRGLQSSASSSRASRPAAARSMNSIPIPGE